MAEQLPVVRAAVKVGLLTVSGGLAGVAALAAAAGWVSGEAARLEVALERASFRAFAEVAKLNARDDG